MTIALRYQSRRFAGSPRKRRRRGERSRRRAAEHRPPVDLHRPLRPTARSFRLSLADASANSTARMATDPARITTPERTAEDADAALRPKSLDEFIGQQAARENLRVFVDGSEEPRRSARPCAAPRPARARQDDARRNPRARDGRRLPRHLGAGDRQVGRPRGAADQPRGRRRPVHRRDPPPQPGGRGSALPGDGGPRARPDDRRRPVGALGPHRSAALHPDRRDDAAGPADNAAARPLRDSGAAQFLHRRGVGAGRAPRCAAARRRADGRWRARDRAAVARAPRGLPGGCCAACATSPMPRVATRSTPRSPTRRCRGWRSTHSASTRWTGAI